MMINTIGELQSVYDEYQAINFKLSNPDVFGFNAVTELKDFIKLHELNEATIEKFDRLMEKQCKEGYTTCKSEMLSDLEYLSFMVMVGNISKANIIAYMDKIKADTLTLCNGFVITTSKNDKNDYIVIFPTDDGNDCMGLDLFLTINKTKN
jgi:hypothetical protein